MGKVARTLMFVPGVFLLTWGLSRLADGTEASEQLVAGVVWFTVALFVARMTNKAVEPFRELAEREERQAELLATGTPAWARVLQVRQTGVFVNRNPEVHLLLQVDHPQLGAYQAEAETVVQMVALPRVQPGQTVGVRVDPDDPQRLSVVL